MALKRAGNKILQKHYHKFESDTSTMCFHMDASPELLRLGFAYEQAGIARDSRPSPDY
ncbi:uncharacterized protein RAG0_08477 [Rhynchosporium agropyri]|uniref:Uncharacterized protein n=1 Tax=Rhynchosporium agropyri TaxID=914238 RepID=A0A1E1KR11_9HELO|nr:uncharacterized protein RAG0_08477 [Rhynchosporium agropyri]